MRNVARAAVTAVLAIALGFVAVPAAVADDDLTVITESGPGDVAHSDLEGAQNVQMSQLDKSVNVDDIVAYVTGQLANSSPLFEVEAAEQDQGENA
ncbi:hypothetical protein [Streptomyces cavernicola]|uniref:Uncharacterized protein n=1 Tax=Streptomyces cavernicola TaxID=3043613 RepID=A0ABT6SEQ1_9ACTN|nr:hypothetical protein [Streptomyces sp. B-S-A6]MDI3405776.1 hypothetical protein [Streptomyces sp. B-S-A6]